MDKSNKVQPPINSTSQPTTYGAVKRRLEHIVDNQDHPQLKAARSGYMFFRMDKHKLLAQQGQKDFTTIARLVGRMWKELSPEERKPYEQLAAEDAIRFSREKDRNHQLHTNKSISDHTYDSESRPKRAKEVYSYAALARGKLAETDDNLDGVFELEAQTKNRGARSTWTKTEIDT